MTHPRSYGQILAAITTGVLLLVPLVLAGYPQFTQNGFPGTFTRMDAVIGFFVVVPLLFVSLAVYQVARYHGLIGSKEDVF